MKQKILIVENDKHNQQLLAMDLTKAGYRTVTIPLSRLKDMPLGFVHAIFMNSGLQTTGDYFNTVYYSLAEKDDALMLSVSYGRHNLGTYRPVEFLEKIWFGAGARI